MYFDSFSKFEIEFKRKSGANKETAEVIIKIVMGIAEPEWLPSKRCPSPESAKITFVKVPA